MSASIFGKLSTVTVSRQGRPIQSEHPSRSNSSLAKAMSRIVPLLSITSAKSEAANIAAAAPLGINRTKKTFGCLEPLHGHSMHWLRVSL